LKNHGSLWAWGWYLDNQNGGIDHFNRNGTPTRIGTGTNWTQICTGGAHNLALKNDGSLWAWGDNREGQLGDGTTSMRSVPTLVGLDRDWRTMAASDMNSFAIRSNGTIWGWGYAATNNYLSSKKIDGRLQIAEGAGANNYLAPRQIESGTNWLALSSELLGFKSDGTYWRMLLSQSAYRPGLPANFTLIGRDRDWTEAYYGQDSFFGRKKDGSWWGWGQNYNGRLGIGTNVTAAASPQRLPFDFDPWAFAAGSGTTLLLGKDGKLWTWGTRLGAAKSTIDNIDQTPFLLWELLPEVRRSLIQ
jgi:alpha-tubulin suppressor-like RCC1 family protein